MRFSKESFIGMLEHLRTQQCAYSMGKQAPRCDCKFRHDGEKCTSPKGSENANGCPELLWCIRLINSLNDKQLENFLRHGTLTKPKKVTFKTPF